MKYFLDKINNSTFVIVNFEYTPSEGEVEISEDEYNEFMNQNFFTSTEEDRLNSLRAQRKVLLNAFDKYKSNVNYGIVEEDEITRYAVIMWYNQLLNLEQIAFDNVPYVIQYYLN